ncbi:amidohydrolase family protein [Trebonia sp.]|uniref:amidohydrolase family protein n=1 Tax=Trebonia sp. TaxID=2767075 RepID=UPI0026032C81|nr:amidohydrolase family protein [Trebonia sp.]
MTTSASAKSRNVVIRGGYVLTMGSAGDIPGGDVHIRDGEIRSVGVGLDTPGAEVIDAAGKIVAPGLVDTHWHMWNTLLRGLSDGRPGANGAAGYFATCVGLGRHFIPADTYAGTRLACAEAVNAGITTVHDWAHNIRGLDWAEAGLRALAESGLRARFSYGYETGHPNDRSMAVDDLTRVASGWPAYSADGRLHLGMAWRGSGGSNPAMRVAREIYLAEIEAARGLGLPVTVHACGPRAAAGQIEAYAAAGLLGPDLQVVHLNSASPREVSLAAEHGTPASVSPFTELQIGYGLPVTGQLLAAGLPTGLSVDTTMLSGNADMFAIMKVTQGCANALAHDEFALTARDVLRLATIDGARTLGLDGVTGSLTPGKRADVIVVSADAPNMGVLTDPARLLVTAAHPGNVDTVLADGRLLKRSGVLTGYDVDEVIRSARAALAGVLARA